ncbi:MAG: hypothetical protein J0H54_02290 [Rhizobiales bacterium]|nr:hypothetical protein [Hyphomicrobiales bacterium]
MNLTSLAIFQEKDSLRKDAGDDADSQAMDRDHNDGGHASWCGLGAVRLDRRLATREFAVGRSEINLNFDFPIMA